MENQVWSHLKCKLPNCHMVCGGKDAGDSRWVIFLEAGGGYGSLQGGSESQGGADSLSGHGGSGVSMAILFGLATIAMDMCPSPKIFLDKSIKPGALRRSRHLRVILRSGNWSGLARSEHWSGLARSGHWRNGPWRGGHQRVLPRSVLWS